MARASTQKTTPDRIKSNTKDTKISFAMGRQIHSGVSAGQILGSGQGASTTGVPIENYLPTAGGTMMGPISFFPQTGIIVSDTLDVSSSGAFSSYVYVTGQSGVADNLSIITGATHAGQLLVLQAILTTPITLQDTAGGNIDLPGGTDVIIPGAGTATLMFDPTVAEGGNRWVLIAIGAAGGSGVTNKISQGDSYIEVIDTGLGLIQFNIDGVAQGNITNLLGWHLQNELRMDGNFISFDTTNTTKLVAIADIALSLELLGLPKYTFSTLGLDISSGFVELDEIATPLLPGANALKVYAKDVGGITKFATLDSAGTESIMGSGGPTFADDVFKIFDNLDSTSSVIFNLDGMTTGVQSAIVFSDTSGRVYTMPNITTVLAGWSVPNFFDIIQTFNSDAVFNSNVTLGNAASDNITFIGDTVGHITPNTSGIDDLGGVGQLYRDLHLSGIANLVTIAGTVTHTGVNTFTGSVTSINSANIFLGDSAADNLAITAQITSNFIPDVNNSLDLGSSGLRWNDIFLGGAINHASTGTVGFFGVSPAVRQPSGGFSGSGDTLQQLKDKHNTMRASLITLGLLN